MNLFGLEIKANRNNDKFVRKGECHEAMVGIGREISDLKKDTSQIPNLIGQIGELKGRLDTITLFINGKK